MVFVCGFGDFRKVNLSHVVAHMRLKHKVKVKV